MKYIENFKKVPKSAWISFAKAGSLLVVLYCGVFYFGYLWTINNI